MNSNTIAQAVAATTVKKVVLYHRLEGEAHVGQCANLIPLDHPDTYSVTNGYGARTSTVVAYDAATGRIETLNTVYMPMPGGDYQKQLHPEAGSGH